VAAPTLAAGLSAAFSLGAFLVSASGKSTLPDRIQARTDQLSTELAADLGQTAANFSMIGRLIASDHGKLTEFQKVRLSDAWKLEPSSEPAKAAITKAARQWFAAALAPAAAPFLAIAWNARPNDLACDFYKDRVRYTGHPWRNEPALAQFRAVIGYENGQPVTQSVFFSKAPDVYETDNGPPESLVRFLFESPTGVQLNHYAFMSDATFGRTRNVVDGNFCFESPGSSRERGSGVCAQAAVLAPLPLCQCGGLRPHARIARGHGGNCRREPTAQHGDAVVGSGSRGQHAAGRVRRRQLRRPDDGPDRAVRRQQRPDRAQCHLDLERRNLGTGPPRDQPAGPAGGGGSLGSGHLDGHHVRWPRPQRRSCRHLVVDPGTTGFSSTRPPALRRGPRRRSPPTGDPSIACCFSGASRLITATWATRGNGMARRGSTGVRPLARHRARARR
jgi:hypothetical protein